MAYISSATDSKFDRCTRSSTNRRRLINPSTTVLWFLTFLGFLGLQTSVAANYCPEKSLATSEHIAAHKYLKLYSGSYYEPHPDKRNSGGEDAHFISSNGRAVGVADGVGGWGDMGINSGVYAQNLMSNSLYAIQEEPAGKIDPARVLEIAYKSTKDKGSSTACIIALTDEGLHAINLGDSGFLVVRKGSTLFRSPAQQHDFNFPYQLENRRGSDLPTAGQVFRVCVKDGDVIIAGTDGVFDNLFDDEIISVVVGSVKAGFEPGVTSRHIVDLALERANNSTCRTPFSEAAGDAGFQYHGGKLDDITVVVSYVTSNDIEKLDLVNSDL